MIWADFLAVRFRRSAPVQSASSIQNRMAHLVADLRTSGTLREIRVSRLNSWREPLGRRSLGASPPAAGQVELGEASRLYGSCGRGSVSRRSARGADGANPDDLSKLHAI